MAVIYRGDVDELDGMPPYRDGGCVALVQELTDVGHTSRWRPGPRVVDLLYLNPGTVIANFKNGRFPNEHHYHAALFVEFGPRSMASGLPMSIWVIDQWAGMGPARRYKKAYAGAREQRGIAPADNANEFYVVQV